MERKKNTKWSCPSFLAYFSKNLSTIHGVKFVGDTRLHKLERIFWIIVVLIAATYAILLVKSNWDHYSANPTVMSIKKDFRNWENPFPAATGCFLDKVDEIKAESYIFKKWIISSSDSKYNYYMDFIRTISNLTYRNLYNLEQFQSDPTLANIDMVHLVTEVHPNLTGVLVTFQSKVKTDWQMVLTELGLCFSINSGFADLLSPSYSGTKDLKLRSGEDILRCHFLNGLCYARYDSDPNMPIEYHIHSYLDVIHATSEPPLYVGKSEEFEINYRLIETVSAPDIRYLTPSQRKCRFDDEALTKNVPVYSTSMCNIVCRHELAIKKCGCKPFFYAFLDGKVCDIKGLLCLAKISYLFNQSLHHTGCNCPQPCNIMVYLKETPKLTKWETGYFDQRITFRWGLMPPTTKFHRSIIFGFQDLIVSFGGILSLFLGMSFITSTEAVIIIFEYFVMMCKKYRKFRKISQSDNKLQK